MANVGPLTIAVLIKQVPDIDAVRVDRAKGTIVPSPQLVISSYDAYAIEAALRLKEAIQGEVVAVTAGPASARDALTRALAMGADRGIHLQLPDVNASDTLGLARLLADAIRPLRCDLVFAGQASDDVEAGQVGAQVAALLDMPVLSNVVELRLDDSGLCARRDMEDGFQTVQTALPAVVLASTGLDQPRLPTLKGIMGAKKKPIAETSVSAEKSRLTWEEPFVPARTVSGTIVQDAPPAEAVRQLVAWLQEQKLI
jgi:electron transfer flavoprotein beta subunit